MRKTRNQINDDLSKSGIYIIQNMINHKVYVGSTVWFKERMNSHFNKLRKKEHDCEHLQRSFNKYGRDNFEFKVIEYISDIEKLNSREQFWFGFYSVRNHNLCFNSSPTAGSNRGISFSEEQKNVFYRRGNARNSRVVCQLDLHGNLLKVFECIQDAAEFVGVNHTGISLACSGKRKSIAGFQWCFYKELNKKRGKKYTKHDNRRIITQLDLNGNIIKRWNSIKDASCGTGNDPADLVNCCNKRYKTIGGFQWCYVEDEDEMVGRVVNIGRFRKVVQLNKGGMEIKTWNSIKEATEKLELAKTAIFNVFCGKQNSAGGFFWKYADVQNTKNTQNINTQNTKNTQTPQGELNNGYNC